MLYKNTQVKTKVLVKVPGVRLHGLDLGKVWFKDTGIALIALRNLSVAK